MTILWNTLRLAMRETMDSFISKVSSIPTREPITIESAMKISYMEGWNNCASFLKLHCNINFTYNEPIGLEKTDENLSQNAPQSVQSA